MLRLLLLSCLFAISAQAELKPRPEITFTSEKAIRYTTIPVILTPKERAVLSSRVVSSVQEIIKHMGQSFSAREPLIILDNTLELAAKERAVATLERAHVLYRVKKRLFDDQVASLLELADAKGALGVALAENMAADKAMADTVIQAPYHGEVDELYINENEGVEIGSKLISIFNDDVLLAKMLLPFSFLRFMKVGNKISIYLLETGQVIEATITYIAENVDPASNTFKLFAEVPNFDHRLRSGMSGVLQYNLQIPTFSFGEKDAFGK